MDYGPDGFCAASAVSGSAPKRPITAWASLRRPAADGNGGDSGIWRLRTISASPVCAALHAGVRVDHAASAAVAELTMSTPGDLAHALHRVASPAGAART
jgi:hypothetical protein